MNALPAPDAPERLEPPAAEPAPAGAGAPTHMPPEPNPSPAGPEPLVDMTKEMRLSTPPPPVTRLSPKAIIGLSFTIAVLMGVIVTFALSDSDESPKPNLVDTANVRRPESLNGLPKDYTGPILGQPLPGDYGGPLLDQANRQASADQLPLDPLSSDLPAPQPDPRIERAAQERDAARGSQIFFAEGEQRAAPTATAPAAPLVAPEATGAAADAAPPPPSPASRRQAFLDRASDTRFEWTCFDKVESFS